MLTDTCACQDMRSRRSTSAPTADKSIKMQQCKHINQASKNNNALHHIALYLRSLLRLRRRRLLLIPQLLLLLLPQLLLQVMLLLLLCALTSTSKLKRVEALDGVGRMARSSDCTKLAAAASEAETTTRRRTLPGRRLTLIREAARERAFAWRGERCIG